MARTSHFHYRPTVGLDYRLSSFQTFFAIMIVTVPVVHGCVTRCGLAVDGNVQSSSQRNAGQDSGIMMMMMMMMIMMMMKYGVYEYDDVDNDDHNSGNHLMMIARCRECMPCVWSCMMV
eukprot:2286121-Amphidinium_carterae.1